MKDQDCDTTLMNSGANTLHSGIKHVLGLLHRGGQYYVHSDDAPFVIGRDSEACDLCVVNEYGSRKHCVIEYREGKFVLRDNSTNGTYVQLGRAGNVRVHNETVPLIGQGSFKLGQDFRPDDPDLVHFVVRETRV